MGMPSAPSHTYKTNALQMVFGFCRHKKDSQANLLPFPNEIPDYFPFMIGSAIRGAHLCKNRNSCTFPILISGLLARNPRQNSSTSCSGEIFPVPLPSIRNPTRVSICPALTNASPRAKVSGLKISFISSHAGSESDGKFFDICPKNFHYSS